MARMRGFLFISIVIVAPTKPLDVSGVSQRDRWEEKEKHGGELVLYLPFQRGKEGCSATRWVLLSCSTPDTWHIRRYLSRQMPGNVYRVVALQGAVSMVMPSVARIIKKIQVAKA